jgi:hypothetical protein
MAVGQQPDDAKKNGDGNRNIKNANPKPTDQTRIRGRGTSSRWKSTAKPQPEDRFKPVKMRLVSMTQL